MGEEIKPGDNFWGATTSGTRGLCLRNLALAILRCALGLLRQQLSNTPLTARLAATCACRSCPGATSDAPGALSQQNAGQRTAPLAEVEVQV